MAGRDAVLLLLVTAATSVVSPDVLRQNVSLNVDLVGVRLFRPLAALPDATAADARRRRLVVVRRRRRKNDDDKRMEGIMTDDDDSWEDGAKPIDGIHGAFLNSLSTLPRALPLEEDVTNILTDNGSFNSSEYLDRHLMFLRERRQGPALNFGPLPAGHTRLAGPPMGPAMRFFKVV
ncbi:uncharacterized protein LOC125945145 [Dermacentor silvarum]|uniref:uncharacterized protein LOC125945145 n=1 Tax=Dermacentor silvarum TaxID=543639 RepID=UPI002100CCCA|nr:uncharacterized protein LOC125945145 [Dermacentor silvarum]